MTLRAIALAAIAAFGLVPLGCGYAQEPGNPSHEELLKGVERLSFLRGDWNASFFSTTAEGL